MTLNKTEIKKKMGSFLSLKKTNNNMVSSKLALKILKAPLFHIFILLLLFKIVRIIYRKINVYIKKNKKN